MASLLGTSSRFVVLTGQSGAGKSEAIHALEDLGYFCVDNLPVALLGAFADGVERDFSVDTGTPKPSAVVADVRDPNFLTNFPRALKDLRRRKALRTVLIFLEAGDEALVRRFSETRRPHPFAPDRSVLDGIVEERSRLAVVKRRADHVLDTSDLTVHELRRAFMQLSHGRSNAGLVATLVSFGYKHGIPLEADLLLDVRFLPNPHFEPKLRQLTGRDRAVQRYLEQLEQTQLFLTKTTEFLAFLIPQYVQEGKKYLTIGIGCTGGQHRSVFIVDRLRRLISSFDGVRLRIKHRDVVKA